MIDGCYNFLTNLGDDIFLQNGAFLQNGKAHWQGDYAVAGTHNGRPYWRNEVSGYYIFSVPVSAFRGGSCDSYDTSASGVYPKVVSVPSGSRTRGVRSRRSTVRPTCRPGVPGAKLGQRRHQSLDGRRDHHSAAVASVATVRPTFTPPGGGYKGAGRHVSITY